MGVIGAGSGAVAALRVLALAILAGVVAVSAAALLGGDAGVWGSRAVLGDDPGVAFGVFRLGQAWPAVLAGGWSSAWLAPAGAPLWPGVESLVMGPIVGMAGPVVAWNVLVVVRVIAAGAGALQLLADRGAAVRGAALVAVTLGATHIAALPDLGAMAWAPLGVALLCRGGGLPGAILAGLCLSTTASLFGGFLLGWAAGVPLRTRGAASAGILAGVGVALEAWNIGASGSAFPGLASSMAAFSAPPAAGSGSLAGALGLGPLVWGSPVLVVAIAGAFGTERGRRGAWLTVLGAVLALGPVLRPWEAPMLRDGRVLPLPGGLLSALPPLSACSHFAGLGFLACLGAVIVLAETTRKQRGLLLLAPAGLLGLRLGVTTVPEVGSVEPGAAAPGSVTLNWPPPEGAAGLWGALNGESVPYGPERSLPATIDALVHHAPFSLATFQSLLKEAGITTLRIDPLTPTASSRELSWLTGGPVAVVGARVWPDVHLESLDAPPPAHASPLPSERRPSGDWSARDPDLAAFFDLSMVPDAMVQVSAWTSEDGVEWTRNGVIAHSLGSLGLTVVSNSEGAEEALVLTTTPSTTLAVSLRMGHLHSSSVMALTTADGVTWGARQWHLTAPLAVIDPQVDWVAGAFRVVAWIRTGAMSTDPVHLPGGHPVFRGAESRPGWFDVDPPEYASPYLADPMIVDDLLFATVFPIGAPPAVRVVRRGEHGYVDIADIVGLTVPYAWKDAGGYRLLAHSFSPDGMQSVVTTTSPDGATWTAPLAYAGVGPRCESPVQTKFRGKQWLFCSERIKNVTR